MQVWEQVIPGIGTAVELEEFEMSQLEEHREVGIGQLRASLVVFAGHLLDLLAQPFRRLQIGLPVAWCTQLSEL